MATIRPKLQATLGLFLVLLLMVPAWAGAQTSFNRIIVFGDSLSDPGNAFAISGMANTPPYQFLDELLIPDRPYARGGHHFSNGMTWIEQLARQLSLSGNTRPAFREFGGAATNYAIGGARAGDRAEKATMTYEVTTFLNVFGGHAPADALYVIEFGGNDIRDAIEAQDPGVINQAISSIQSNITALYNAGARKFLVCFAPDLSLTPALIATDKIMPGAATAARQMSQYYNYLLDYLVTSMSSQLADMEVVRVDFFSTLTEVAGNPAEFGLSVVDATCVTPGFAPYACSNPNTFLFWDGIHPTEKVHSIIAQRALSELVK
ncbi:SGNH/GDSL hydrolase family protein [Geomonas ferrireducens]|uniref:SGNH/GDSL hydrolase family protein n=1 Tax=Geomonas ferrireducens TaxID=2570227 RepID=UPI0010A831B0|nr:SGNH/GDSL hydrolase family protein [Geomonas ferrireducens]